jgi:heat shock protein 1/8
VVGHSKTSWWGDVLRISNEPTASLIAYGLDKKGAVEQRQSSVIFSSITWGSFDVSLLTNEDGVFEYKANAGDIYI